MVNYCRYCLTVSDENVQKINQAIADVTKNVLPELDLTITEEPVICNQCEADLKKCFNFKSRYISTIDSVLKSVDLDNTVLGTLDLREILMKKHNISDIDMAKNQNVCPLCFELIKDEFFVSLAEVDEHVLDNCIFLVVPNYNPIKHFGLALDHVICISCHNYLMCYSSFINKCMETERKVKKLGREFDMKEEINNLTFCLNKSETGLANGDLKQEDMMGLLEDSEVNVKIELQTDELIIESDIVYPKTEDVTEYQDYIHEDMDQEDESELKLHTTERGELPMYHCKTCSYKSKSKKSYDVHIAKGHVKKYSCEYCTCTAVCRSRVETHMLTHKDRSEVTLYKCCDCDFETIYHHSLKRHELIHKDPSEVTLYKCHVCDYESIWQKSLKMHKLKHKDPSEVTYKCCDCDFKTIYHHSLKRHELIHKDPSEVTLYKCHDCDYESIWQKSLKMHKLKHKDPSEVTYKCCDCGFKTIYQKSLKSHELTHKDPSELIKYKCLTCDFESIHERNLRKHVLKHRDPAAVTKYKCRDCNFESIRKGHLKQHELTHKDLSEVKLYECRDCDFKSARKESLKKHVMRRSSKSTKYKCQSCDYESICKGGLRKHEMTHKDVAELMKYKCPHCSFKAMYRNSLRRHVLLHKSNSTNYKCPECDFETINKVAWKKHKLKHKDSSAV